MRWFSSRPAIGCSGRSVSEVLTSTVTFTLSLSSVTVVVRSDSAVTLFLNAFTEMMRERSLLGDMPMLMPANTSFRQLSRPLNRSFTFTTTLAESFGAASAFKLHKIGLI